MSPDLLLLLLFPLICAVIGYVTNVVAVKMIFRPHERVSIAGVSFQGVLPKHQQHFAHMLAQVITRDFVNTADLVSALDRPELADRIEALVRELAPAVVAELREAVPQAQRAMINDQMTAMVVDQVIAEARKRTPEIVAALSERSQEVLDLTDLVTEKIVAWGARGLEEVIYQVSKRELDFIEYYGAIFGFALGLFQWAVLQLIGDIALPIVGCIVGTVTNWLAIQMLFYPRQPTVYLGFFRYQGMFPAGQERMAATMGHIASKELILPGEIFAVLAERLLPATVDVAQVEAAEGAIRGHVPQLFQVADALVPEGDRPALRERIARLAEERVPGVRDELVKAATDHLDVDGMLSERVAALEKSEFEALLRGLFEREEIYLIIYGGLLGGAIGALQLLLVGWLT